MKKSTADDECVDAIHALRKLSDVPYGHAVPLGDACYEMITHVQTIMKHGSQRDAKDLHALIKRLETIVEYRNMMSCGALGLIVGDACQSAWERLPGN